MSIGWQEIIVLAVVGFAVWRLVRRALQGRSGGKGGCGGCAGAAPPGRVVKIQELHTIEVQRPALPEAGCKSPAAPRSEGSPGA